MVAEPASPRASTAVEPDGFRHARIEQVQRARILAGAVQAVCEHGVANTAIAEIVHRAGVSRRTFYELFADRDECIVAALDDALAVATARVAPVVAAERRWLDRMRAGTAALMCFLDEEPQLGRLLVCESLAAGRVVADWRGRVVVQLAAFVEKGGRESRSAERVAPMQAEASVGGVLAILQGLLADDTRERESFAALTPSLVAMVALPYLGQAVAGREMRRQAPESEVRAHSQDDAPEFSFKEAGMRVTYRTVRVLLAIADHPGASNRQIGDFAEIDDKGQASKLLRRLVRAGLIDNGDAAPSQGAANAWRLTPAGRQFAEKVRAYSNTPAPNRRELNDNPRRVK